MLGGFLGGLAGLGSVLGNADESAYRDVLRQLGMERMRQARLQSLAQRGLGGMVGSGQLNALLGQQPGMDLGQMQPLPGQGGAQVPGTQDQGIQAQLPQVPSFGATGGMGTTPQIDPTLGYHSGNLTGRIGGVTLPQLTDEIYNLESSRGRNARDSSAGAVGPMQITPQTAAGYGVGGAALRNPQLNKQLGDTIVGDLYSKYGGNPDLTAIAYNAGPGRADKIAAGAPMSSLPHETQNYVAKMHQDLKMMIAQNSSPEDQQRAQIGVQNAVRSIPNILQAAGRIDLDGMARLVNQFAPSDDPEVKGIMFTSMFNMLSPLAKEEFSKTIQLEEFGLKRSDLKEQRKQRETFERERLDILRGNQVLAGQRLDQAEGKIPPATQAFDAYMKQYRATHDGKDPPPEAQQQFILSGKPPRSAAAQSLRVFIDEYTSEHGKPPGSEELRNFQAGTAEAVTEGRVTGTRAASLDQAGEVLDAMIPLLKDASAKVDRTNYPTINKIILAYQEGTGDRDVVQYGEMINEIRYLYARALSPTGQARVADLQHFDEVMNKSWSQGQIGAGLDQIQKSIAVERDVIKKRREEIRGPGAAPTAGAGQPGQGTTDWSKLSNEELIKRAQEAGQ